MKWRRRKKNNQTNAHTVYGWKLQRPRSPNPEKLNANNINYSWYFRLTLFILVRVCCAPLLQVHHTVALVDFHRKIAHIWDSTESITQIQVLTQFSIKFMVIALACSTKKMDEINGILVACFGHIFYSKL